MRGAVSYFSLVLIVTCAFGTAPTMAADDPEICRVQSGKTAFEACNRVINSGKCPENTIADSYTGHGQAWNVKANEVFTVPQIV